MRGSQVRNKRIAFRTPYRRTPSKPPPRSSESPTEPEPARTQRTRMARSPGGAVLCFGAMLSFQIVVRAKPLECSDLPKKYKKRGRQSIVLGLFWVWALARFRTSGSSPFLWGLIKTPQLPAKRSPRRRPPPSKPPPRAEVRCRCTSPHATAALSAWTCFSRPAPRRRASRRSQGGFGRVRGGKFRCHPMNMSCYLPSSSFHGHLRASLSRMFWIRLGNIACESVQFLP